MDQWAEGLRELITMKANVSQYVLPTDTMLLQGQVEQLHSQWEELCLKVSENRGNIRLRGRDWCENTMHSPLGPLEMHSHPKQEKREGKC